ncbi:hypothetical protein RB195_019923 [Necator americanus]|uniref:protein-tyrosine-phosphatase n=1 Tax=Necator americanus TaxID=51031 RepID=A0ABR1CIT8_NECAM
MTSLNDVIFDGIRHNILRGGAAVDSDGVRAYEGAECSKQWRRCAFCAWCRTASPPAPVLQSSSRSINNRIQYGQGMTVSLQGMEISAASLAAIVRNADATTLIVDCRCLADFKQSHICRATNPFYSKLLQRRLLEDKVDHVRLANQLRSTLCGKEFENGMVDVVLYADEQPEKQSTRFCSKRRINASAQTECPVKILRKLRDQLECTNVFGKIQVLEGGFQNFRLQFPQQCESEHSSGVCGMSRLSASISQPCLSSISLQSAPDGPTQIFPFMYLGSQQDALDTEQMRKRGITHVVNLSIGCPRASSITSDENFLRIPVNDSYQEKLSPHFETAWEFLEGVRRSGNVVLIHCLAGISRSPTLAISYVMRYKNMSSEDAYRLVKEKRPSISPNFNFMGQLLEYEQLLIKKGLLSAEASSKRVDRPLSLKQEFDSEDNDSSVGPATKVPKSASTHCVFFDRPRDFSITTTARVNENGKRGLNDSLDRPKVLGLYNADTKRHIAEELPSPSTELSKLTFAGGLPSPSSPMVDHASLSLSNPCFVSPTREALHPEAASTHTEECETSRRSYFKHRIVSLFKSHQSTTCCPQSPQLKTSRPENLQSAGLPFFGLRKLNKANSPMLLTTTEEAESPESGYQDDEYKTSPEDLDRVSISSTGSEITVQ